MFFVILCPSQIQDHYFICIFQKKIFQKLNTRTSYPQKREFVKQVHYPQTVFFELNRKKFRGNPTADYYWASVVYTLRFANLRFCRLCESLKATLHEAILCDLRVPKFKLERKSQAIFVAAFFWQTNRIGLPRNCWRI